MIENNWIRAGLAGLIGALVSSIVAALMFQVIGNGIIFDPNIQSPKLIAVWEEYEPLPLMITSIFIFLIGWLIIGIIHGLIFEFIIEGLPKDVLKRGLSFSLVLWAIMHVFFEFFTPFNLFGEPLYLVAFELLLWSAVDIANGLVISLMYEKLK